ncbi:MAG: hypothetical protein JWM10_937 [Myxococcaceae bacterium]|nr:hypothetical protein [Myxococcaceae bacterium]
MRAPLALLSGLSLLLATPRPAGACSFTLDDLQGCAAARSPEFATLPSNAIFPATCRSGAGGCTIQWSANDRAPLVCDRVDVPLPGPYCRLRAPLPTRLWNPSSPRPPYAATIGFEGEDTTAPAMPSMDIEVQLVSDPSTGGAYGCPDVDRINVHLRAAEPGPMFAVFFFGATADEAATAPRAEAAVGVCSDLLPREFDVTASVGTSVERYRTNEGGFRRAGRYCVTAAMMDVAGNVGARSAAECLSTQDERDPHVVFVAPQSRIGCLCQAGPTGGGAPLAAVAGAALAGIVALRARRRRRV